MRPPSQTWTGPGGLKGTEIGDAVLDPSLRKKWTEEEITQTGWESLEHIATAAGESIQAAADVETEPAWWRRLRDMAVEVLPG